MNIAVCIKQVPNPDAPFAFDPVSKTLVRRGPFVLDEPDSFSVEMALRLVEQAGAGEISLVSVVPNGETQGLRTALAMGADRALIVSDTLLAGLDALGTAKVLASMIRRLGVDLVLAATESSDGYTGTVPVQFAELLGYPSVSFARHVEIAGDSLLIERQTEDGYDEVSCPLPAVITVTAGVVEVRYPSFKGIMAAKFKPVEVLTVSDLGLDVSSFGASAARQEIVGFEQVPLRGAGEIIVDDGEAFHAIVKFLESWNVVQESK